MNFGIEACISNMCWIKIVIKSHNLFSQISDQIHESFIASANKYTNEVKSTSTYYTFMYLTLKKNPGVYEYDSITPYQVTA